MRAEDALPFVELSDPRSDPRLPLERLRQIDVLCQRFEQALQSGSSTTIEDYLVECTDDNLARTALLRELLALELEYRLQRGERPEAAEYRSRYPSDTRIVDLVFQESRRGLPQTVPDFLMEHPRYHVLRWLGSGGMGTVYCAEHRVLQRKVALKIINPELLADAAAVDRFVGEARAAARLSHPNVVAVYDAETAGGEHFLAMEYVAGTDLAQIVLRQGPLPVPLACDYIRQAALGLAHAHQHGMVHRDITPRNLMLTEQGQVKVLDFGLAYFVREARAANEAAVPAVLLGSVDYMAPEQAADPYTADVRADVYGLGCVLYFLLAGQPPFPRGSLQGKLLAHAQVAPPKIGDFRDDVPAEIVTILDRMLAKPPADRYQAPGEVAAALAPLAGHSHASQRAGRGRQTGLLAVASVLIAGILLAGWWASWRPQGRPSLSSSASPEANRLYREGLLLEGQRQEPQMRLAIERLENAVRADPHFAPAHTALADAYNLCGDYG